jgi:hypothetical protein
MQCPIIPAGPLNSTAFKAIAKSIQPISKAISRAAGSWVDSYTLGTAVDTARALILPKSIIGSTATDPFGNAGCYLNSTSQVNFTSYVAGAGTWAATLAADVVEFRARFKSIQWVNGGATSRTINAVNTAKTVILSMNFGAQTNQVLATATLAGSTTVAISNGAVAGASAMWWCVIEFY